MSHPPTLERVRYRSLAQVVSQYLREAMISGGLKPGDRIVEQQVAKSLGISQPTVREGLKELEYEGFVRKIANKGTYVTKLSHADIQKISEVRIALEHLAVGRAVERLTAQTTDRLKTILERLGLAVESQNLIEFHQQDLAFHTLIWELSGNEYLSSSLRRLVFSLFAFVLSHQDSSAFKDAYRQHQQILSALLTGDRRTAQRGYFEATRDYWEKHHQVRLISETDFLGTGGTRQ